ncbi:helix-turn-helix protein [Herbihabitans rhizosphaerae]|uniref:Helix-turn-helix protein n=1 Tax=Herbihabitans rhizosphaerae TaxID=1872711 RepID=A0A4Q7KCG0_9PSEU|nr:helix-turn-helix transcriptional regulator [Herbihabitans rhizosphaerae]RZS30393.1 helix-turn-helix protein [Herbihabitans rhizosphaerae]
MTTHRDDDDPVVQRILLGDQLRELRDRAGFTIEEANSRVPGWYKGKLGKVENGELRTKPAEVDLLLDLYGVTGKAATAVRKLGEQSRGKTSPSRVPYWAKQHIGLERSASEIRLWFGECVPGPLQTREYARAQLQTSLVLAPAEIEPNARERERRGDMLLSDGQRRIWIVLGEQALRKPFGPPELMRGQLARLLEFGAQPHITFRVIETSSGPHVGLCYPFTLLYLERADRTIAHIETLTNAEYLPKPKHTDVYSLAYEHILGAALSEDETRKLVERIMKE